MTLALIAGQGTLPPVLMAAVPDRPIVAALEGFAPEIDADLIFRLETLGTLVQTLVARGCRQVCFAGQIRRPEIDPTQIDAATQPLVARIQQALAKGDDGALRAVIEIFEDAGLGVIGAHEICPTLMPVAGVLTDAQPAQHHADDAQRGVDIVAAMGRADIGQACVVARQQALAIEAMPGTDWMLKSLTVEVPDNAATGTFADDLLGAAADWLSAQPSAKRQRDPSLPSGGVLYKAAKPDQDLRVDMPTIGPETVQGAALAKLDGIVIHAGTVLVLDQQRCIDIANAAGLFIWVRPT